jgi:hypothetical protein
MLPRSLTLVVLGLWIAVSIWLLLREVNQPVDQPPPVMFDLADEVGRQAVTWQIMLGDRNVGHGATSIRRQPGRVFDLDAEFTFSEKPEGGVTVPLERISSAVRCTTRGTLVETSAIATVKHRGGQRVVRVKGEVEQGQLTPRWLINHVEVPLRPEPITAPGPGDGRRAEVAAERDSLLAHRLLGRRRATVAAHLGPSIQ